MTRKRRIQLHTEDMFHPHTRSIADSRTAVHIGGRFLIPESVILEQHQTNRDSLQIHATTGHRSDA